MSVQPLLCWSMSLPAPDSEAARTAPSDALESGSVLLVPATRRQIWATISAPDEVAEELDACLAADWDRDFFEISAADVALRMEEGEEGWWYWWIIERGRRSSGVPELVGVSGFKGPPTPGGTVEVLYGLARSARGRGLGSIAVPLLIDWAFRHAEVERVIATIHPDNKASQGLAGKCGLSVVKELCDDEELVYVVERRGRHRP